MLFGPAFFWLPGIGPVLVGGPLNGKLLLVAHGTPEEVERAKDVLDQTEANSTTVHGEQLATVGA